MKTILSYNSSEVKPDGSIEDLSNGYNIWIDFTDPDHEELFAVANKFNLEAEILEKYFNKSKKPEIRVLDNYTFTVMLDMKNKDPKTLETEGIYLFLNNFCQSGLTKSTNVNDKFLIHLGLQVTLQSLN